MINNNSAKYLGGNGAIGRKDQERLEQTMGEFRRDEWEKSARNTTQEFQFSNDKKWGKSVGRTSNVGDLSILVY